jgi:hypothetical protein
VVKEYNILQEEIFSGDVDPDNLALARYLKYPNFDDAV